MVYLAADHRGFQLKEILKSFLTASGESVFDAGAFQFDPADDYTDFAIVAAEKMVSAEGSKAVDGELRTAVRGIFLCGSGVGMDVVAAKFRGLRPALCHDTETAIQSREHGDTNVLVLAADALSEDEAKEIVLIWLKTPFSGEERHLRRIKKIQELEERNFK